METFMVSVSFVLFLLFLLFADLLKEFPSCPIHPILHFRRMYRHLLRFLRDPFRRLIRLFLPSAFLCRKGEISQMFFKNSPSSRR